MVARHVGHDVGFVGSAEEEPIDVVRFAHLGKIQRHRGGRRDCVEQRPTGLSVVAMIDVDAGEERRGGIGTDAPPGACVRG
jgi:hypothetical protein